MDATYELPIGFEVTKASTHEQPVMRSMFGKLSKRHPEIVNDCEYAMGDRGYDSVKLISQLWDEHRIKPIIDIRKMWRDGDETRQLRNVSNVTYSYNGTVFCHCPKTGTVRQMAYGGFEEKRNALKYRCPALHYGIKCEGMTQCPVAKNLRISLEEDRRVFTPLARSSYKWKKLYNKRSSVERVNSRIETAYCFESHYIRGLAKMKVRCGLSLCVMLAIALGRARAQQYDLMRSLVRMC